jgi:ribosome-associated translation inhibitor RaiA
VKIDIEGLHGDSTLQDRIASRIIKACSRLPSEPTSVLVGFTDENGHKGGPGMRCAITASVPSKKTAHVEARATTPATAFDAVIDSFERWVKEHTDRLMDARRRPKKYYLAKRLLEPEAGAQPPAGRPRRAAARRQRRSRAA